MIFDALDALQKSNTMHSMKATVFHGTNDLPVEDVKRPHAGVGEAVIRVTLTAICGTAFGWYHCAIGLAAVPASLVFGLLWQRWGAVVAFRSGGMLAAFAAFLLSGAREDAPGSLDAKGATA